MQAPRCTHAENSAACRRSWLIAGPLPLLQGPRRSLRSTPSASSSGRATQSSWPSGAASQSTSLTGRTTSPSTSSRCQTPSARPWKMGPGQQGARRRWRHGSATQGTVSAQARSAPRTGAEMVRQQQRKPPWGGCIRGLRGPSALNLAWAQWPSGQ